MTSYLTARGFSEKTINYYGLIEGDGVIKIPYPAQPGEPTLYKIRAILDKKYWYQQSMSDYQAWLSTTTVIC